jgi:hypothetical protein
MERLGKEMEPQSAWRLEDDGIIERAIMSIWDDVTNEMKCQLKMAMTPPSCRPFCLTCSSPLRILTLLRYSLIPLDLVRGDGVLRGACIQSNFW